MEKKIILSGLAGGVTFFLLGWVIYGMLLMDFYSSQMLIPGVNKEIPDFLPLIIGNLAMAFLLALILGRWANVCSTMDGLKIGFVVGLLLGIGFDMIMLGTSNVMTMNGALVDIAVTAVMYAIVGAVEAMVLVNSKKPATA